MRWSPHGKMFIFAALFVIFVVELLAIKVRILDSGALHARDSGKIALSPVRSVNAMYAARVLAFRGPWARVRNRHDGRYEGESWRSLAPHASATLAFDGYAIRIFGVLGPKGGIGRIAIDGRDVGDALFFAPKKATHRVVFASKRLAPGHHQLSISVIPSKSGSHRAYVNFDAVEVDS